MPDLNNSDQSLLTTATFAVAGAALVYYGRRANSGILRTIATTAGYGFLTKAISAVVVAALAPPNQV